MTNSAQGASPSSTRYFYTDPLAAAWMAKYYGMQLQVIKPDGTYYPFIHSLLVPAIHSWEHVLASETLSPLGNIYIHPDSLHLLHPQIGDLVDIGVTDFWRISKFSEYKGKPIAEAGEERSFYLGEIDAIIQRNGITFMWPESDAA